MKFAASLHQTKHLSDDLLGRDFSEDVFAPPAGGESQQQSILLSNSAEGFVFVWERLFCQTFLFTLDMYESGSFTLRIQLVFIQLKTGKINRMSNPNELSADMLRSMVLGPQATQDDITALEAAAYSLVADVQEVEVYESVLGSELGHLVLEATLDNSVVPPHVELNVSFERSDSSPVFDFYMDNEGYFETQPDEEPVIEQDMLHLEAVVTDVVGDWFADHINEDEKDSLRWLQNTIERIVSAGENCDPVGMLDTNPINTIIGLVCRSAEYVAHMRKLRDRIPDCGTEISITANRYEPTNGSEDFDPNDVYPYLWVHIDQPSQDRSLVYGHFTSGKTPAKTIDHNDDEMLYEGIQDYQDSVTLYDDIDQHVDEASVRAITESLDKLSKSRTL